MYTDNEIISILTSHLLIPPSSLLIFFYIFIHGNPMFGWWTPLRIAQLKPWTFCATPRKRRRWSAEAHRALGRLEEPRGFLRVKTSYEFCWDEKSMVSGWNDNQITTENSFYDNGYYSPLVMIIQLLDYDNQITIGRIIAIQWLFPQNIIMISMGMGFIDIYSELYIAIQS
jgi:hypothetical protein